MKRSVAQGEISPNGALLLLGTILENQGHTVRVIHMTADKVRLEQLGEIVKEFNPIVAGITSITFQSGTLRETARVIKRANGRVKIVAGGPHISALITMGYPVAEDYPDIDCFVAGEGDKVFGEVIEEGISTKIIIAEPMKELVTPPINLNLVDIGRFVGAYPPGPQPEMFVMGSRGCVFNCTFCSRSVFGKTVRYRDPIAVVDDAERLMVDWGIKEVFFHDDTFNLNRKWAEKVLRLIINRGLNKGLRFRTPCRVNEKLIDTDLLRLMREAGFWLIFYGVESGSQDMLNRMKKGTTVGEIVRAFKLTKEAGIKTEASFIVGLPGETRETIRSSVELWNEIKPDWGSFTRAIPFPGTELYDEVKQSGHLLMGSFDDIETDKVLCRTEALSGEEIDGYAVALGNMASRGKLKQLLRNPSNLTKVLRDMGIRQGLKQLWQLSQKAKI